MSIITAENDVVDKTNKNVKSDEITVTKSMANINLWGFIFQFGRNPPFKRLLIPKVMKHLPPTETGGSEAATGGPESHSSIVVTSSKLVSLSLFAMLTLFW